VLVLAIDKSVQAKEREKLGGREELLQT